MKGYKAFDKNLKCRGFQYEIGQTYEMDGVIDLCRRGFHFCKDLADCYNYYPKLEDTRICEVEAVGNIIISDFKYCTNKIKILSEVKNPREKSNVNTSSSGYCNSGFLNSGNCNSGFCNSGNYNSMNYNSGDWNSGNCNSGSYNSGDYNSGSFNNGSYNSGNWNSGSYNSGNQHTGVFNCDTNPKIKMFDEDSDWTIQNWYDSKAYGVMCCCPRTYLEYDDEQKKTIIHEVTAKDKQEWWDGLDENDKNAIKALPNFNAEKFYLCTEIRVE